LELLNSILRSTDFCVFSAMTLHIKATVERWPVEGHFTIARGAMHLLLEFHDLVHCHGNLGMMRAVILPLRHPELVSGSIVHHAQS
jgi:hypothetical protein